jgi:hypothetical protein
LVVRFCTFHASSVVLSHSAALGAFQGASTGRVARQRPVEEQDVVTLVIGREDVHADRLGERQDAVLRRADVLAADLRDHALLNAVVESAPAHAIARLEDTDLLAGGGELARRGQTGEAGPHDRYVDLAVALALLRGGGAGQQRPGATGGGACE